MKIDLNTMNEMHKIQLEMMAELIRVMDVLDIKYYFVHGSLLGAVTKNDFIVEDDDIDIAIFRDDYNKLLTNGNKYLDERYFLQCSLNDDFPLAFAKMRNNNTAFIQPILKECSCNKGIYIDIFPIDYCPSSIVEEIKEKFLSFRINQKLYTTEKISFKKRIAKCIVKVLYPSYKKAILKREKMYSSRKKMEFVNITNGKKKERNIPVQWFDEICIKKFSGLDVMCPAEYHNYLKKIYGEDYFEFNPAIDRISDNNLVEISAELLSFDKSYKEF